MCSFVLLHRDLLSANIAVCLILYIARKFSATRIGFIMPLLALFMVRNHPCNEPKFKHGIDLEHMMTMICEVSAAMIYLRTDLLGNDAI